VSNLSLGSSGSYSSSAKAHLPHVSTLSRPGTSPYPASYARRPAEWPVTVSRFPIAFRPPAFASWASCSRQGVGLSLRSAYRATMTTSRTLTGFPRSPCTRHDRGGCPLNPGASGVHTTGKKSPIAAYRSSTARPYTPVFIPSPGAHNNEASTGVQFRSPVRPSPHLRPRMERERFGFSLELRTPQLPATHVKVGTGLEHWPGTTHPTCRRSSHLRVHSPHATSCRSFFFASTLTTGRP
jgi:hypothetical protein